MLYILVSIWLMRRVVADSSNMESKCLYQTVHQSFSPNLPYSHTNLVSGSMFISVNYPKKLNIPFKMSYFFTQTKFIHVIKAFRTWSIYHNFLKSSVPYSDILMMTTAWPGKIWFALPFYPPDINLLPSW